MLGCVERFESKPKWRGMRNAAKLKEEDRDSRRTKEEGRNDSQSLLVVQPDGDGSGSKQTGVGVAVKGGDAGGEPTRRDDLI